MPRPVSLFEPMSVPVSGLALAATTGSDAGVADTGAYDLPDSSVPGPPITRSAAVGGVDADTQPDRLKPRLQAAGQSERLEPHPSTGDISSSALGRRPAQDASRGDISSPAVSRAAASNVQGTPITRSAPARGADAHDQADRLAPALQPHPSTGDIPSPVLSRRPAQDAATDDVSSSVLSRATARDTVPGDISPRASSRWPAPDAATGGDLSREASRAAASNISGVEAATGGRANTPGGIDSRNQPDRLKPRLQSEGDAGPEAAGGRAVHPHPPVTPAVRQAGLPGPGMAQSAQSPAAAEPPIVRVTIGRVEVRAVLPPPVVEAPRTQRLAPPVSGPPLSLDDYLKQGRGGA